MSHAATRQIPSVDRLLHELGPQELPRPLVVLVVRRELEALRTALLAGEAGGVGDLGGVIARIRAAIENLRLARLGPVVNATGIIVHTNLGRSPLPSEALRSVAEASAYTNLEMDLTSGERGRRGGYIETAAAALCGAEAAIVVNNCAAALVLAIHALTKSDRDEVVVSRGELVQIGGGFRVPDILEASGARLREVGTTNRTTIGDYRRAVSERTALILAVHRSNFYMGGFVESAGIDELASLAREHEVPLLADLGSGANFDTRSLGGDEHEPMPLETLAKGVDLVCFSGDKLLGGPQAGIIAGRDVLVRSLRQHPLFRALRCDKLVLAALQATLELHLAGASNRLPIMAMARASVEELRARAAAIVGALGDIARRIEVIETEAQIGGGALPRTTIASIGLAVRTDSITSAECAARLRRANPPVVASISKGRVVLDIRTILPEQDGVIVRALQELMAPAL